MPPGAETCEAACEASIELLVERKGAMGRQRRQPWRTRCSYAHPTGGNCESVTPGGWAYRVSHAGKLGEQSDESRGAVTVTPELRGLAKPLRDLNSAEWESIRLRLIRTAATAVL